MNTQSHPFYFPPLASLLYFLSIFAPSTLTCASPTLPLFNHCTMVCQFNISETFDNTILDQEDINNKFDIYNNFVEVEFLYN